jgi:hypothetical protein
MNSILFYFILNRRTARNDAEFKHKKPQQSILTSPQKSLFKFVNRKMNSPTTPTNDQVEDDDDT